MTKKILLALLIATLAGGGIWLAVIWDQPASVPGDSPDTLESMTESGQVAGNDGTTEWEIESDEDLTSDASDKGGDGAQSDEIAPLPPGSGIIHGIVHRSRLATGPQAARPLEVFLYVVHLPKGVEEAEGAQVSRVLGGDRAKWGGAKEFRGALRRAARATAGEEGQFEFAGLAAGKYLLAACDAGSLLSPSELITLDDGETEACDVNLEAGFEIRGHVRSPAGDPIAGAEVRFSALLASPERGARAQFLPLHELLLHLLNPLLREYRSDAAGDFLAMELCKTPYSIRVSAPPCAPALLRADPEADRRVEIVLELGARVQVHVSDENETDIQGASVLAKLEQEAPSEFLGAAAPPASATTDAAGIAELAALESANYQIAVNCAGYQRTLLEGVALDREAEVQLRVRLLRGEVIAGRVIDASGAALPEVNVRARRVSSSGNLAHGEEERLRQQSAADGRFRFDTLREGEYELELRRDGLVTASVKVVSGTSNLEIEMHAGDSIRGRILADRDAAPIPGAVVRAFRDGGRLARTDSNERGEFVITGVEAGRLELRARADGFLPLALLLDNIPEEALTLSLRVAPRLGGIVFDANGSPCAGATVSAELVAASLGGSTDPASHHSAGRAEPARSGVDLTPSVTSDGNGKFLLTLPWSPGAWRLRARSAGFLDGESEVIEVDDQDRTGLSIQLQEGVKLVGRVVDERDQGIADARLEFRLEGGGARVRGGSRDGSRRHFRALSGADGGFALEGLEPGRYSLEAVAAGFGVERQGDVSVGAERADEILVRLKPEIAVAGRVSDEQGSPLPGAVVKVHGKRSDKSARASTLEDGSFRVSGFADEPFELRVECPGFAPWRADGIHADDAALEISLKAALTWVGEVMDKDDSKRIAGARIVADERLPSSSPDRKAIQETTRSDADGAFLLDELAPGYYRVSVEADNYIDWIMELDLSKPETQRLIVQLTRGGALIGSIADEAGYPVEGARVLALCVRPAGGESAGNAPARREKNTRSDSAGKFKIGGLADGIYQVRIQHRDFLTLVAPDVSVGLANAGDEMRFVLSRGAELEGQVLRAGQPVGVGFVDLRGGNQGAERFQSAVDSRGWFRIAGVPAGDFVLSYQEKRGGEAAGATAVSVPGPGRLIRNLNL